MARAYNHWSKGPNAAEIGKRLGDLQRGKKQDPELVAKRKKANEGFRHTEEAKQRMKKPKSPEHVAKMVANHASRGPNKEEFCLKIKATRTTELRLKVANDVRSGVCGFRLSKWQTFSDRKGRSFRMRSTWEVKLALWMDSREVDWDYEPESLVLSDGSVYIPDFKLKDGRYIEVKGYLSPEAAKKIILARDLVKLIVLNERALKRLGVL